MVWNATPLACSSAASPVIAASRCGTVPSVHAKAASTLARGPRDRPADRVKSAPVPGVATMTNDVSRNVSTSAAYVVVADPDPKSRWCAARPGLGGRHVDEAAVVPLERDRDRVGGPVAV